MAPESQGTQQASPLYRKWLRGSLIFLVLLVVVRFILEVAGAPANVNRFFSSTTAVFLVAIYLGAVAPLRGVTRFTQLIIPAVVVSAWATIWVVLATLVAGVLRLERSHFAEKEDYGDWAQLGRHILAHFVEMCVVAVIVLVLMAVPYLLRRWPVTVGPGAILGAFVIMRFFIEAMGLEQWRAAAWSSTVVILLSSLYLGGISRYWGLTSARSLLAPSLVLGWTWRFWVFMATLLSALVPFYKTHFFDSSQGRVAVRLAQFVVFGLGIEGLLAGLVVWGISTLVARATRPATA